MKSCSILGCSRPHYARGWCNPHWQKVHKYGDPLAGRNRAAKGEPLVWLLSHVNYNSDECLIWPYAKDTWGYGDLWIGKKHLRANRYMCELAHGPAPSVVHEAAHACGNGHIGCINPSHLYWGTSKENNADKRAHGTLLLGADAPQSKLTEPQVLKIREMAASGVPQRKIAAQFNICQQAVSDIHRRVNWAWL